MKTHAIDQAKYAMVKYRLNELIDNQSSAFSRNRRFIIQDLAELCDVSTVQVWRYGAIKKSDSKQIPSDKLRIIAKYFGVSMEQIYNDKS